MKILVLCNKPPYPPTDGGSIASWGLISSLAKAGNELTVLTMNTRKHHITPFDIPEEIKTLVTFHLAEVAAPITLTGALHNLLFSKLPYNAERFIDDSFNQKIVGLLNHQSFDIIQLEGLYLCPYIDTIRQHSQARIAYRSHNVEYEIWERTLAQSKWIKQFYLKILVSRLKKFETRYLNQYDLLIPITQRDNDKLNTMGNIRPSLPLPAGIDLSGQPPLPPSDIPDLFYIGALDWAPNTEGLLWFLNHCWLTIQKQHPELKLYIAGRNAPQWFIKRIQPFNVIYLGEIPDSKAYMNDHSVMIVPLLSGSGMRVKIIEAMGCGKAIVSTSIGCEGIDAVDGVHLLKADTPENFIEAIDKLVVQSDLRTFVSKNCFTFVTSNYSNPTLALKLKSFYEKQQP